MFTNRREKARKAVYAGSWYPDKAPELKKLIDVFFAGTPDQGGNRPVALVVPHAGFAYSGEAAAAGYKALEGFHYDKVIVLAPSHRQNIRGCATCSYTSYLTPLGSIPVANRELKDLERISTLFNCNDAAHIEEHAIELQLPFLYTVLSDFKLVPLVIGEGSSTDFKEVVSAIDQIVDEKTLVIASSDFTHYGSNFGYVPFDSNVQENLHRLDMGAIERICDLAPGEFQEYIDEEKPTICGKNPIKIILLLFNGRGRGRLIDYYTSAKKTGDWANSVSYAAVVIHKNDGTSDHSGMEEVAVLRRQDDLLNESEQHILLEIACETIERFVKQSDMSAGKVEKSTLTARLTEPRGAFVTLKKKGSLRGCIGYVTGTAPLYKTVIDNTINAAGYDPRFPPVTEEELPGMEIEISVLTPLRLVGGFDDIEIGRDGLYVRKIGKSGLLLPQVAVEQGWDKKKFLEQTCLKAGLPSSAWKKGIKIYTFSAQILHKLM